MSESTPEDSLGKPLTAARLRIVRSDGQPVPVPPVRPAKPQRFGRDDLYISLKLQRFEHVATLPGKALAVFGIIVFEARTKGRRSISLGNTHLPGIDRHAKRKALQSLVRAGLISVAVQPGHNPEVTLCDALADELKIGRQ